jgi:transposase
VPSRRSAGTWPLIFLDDLRRIDTQMRETKKRLTAAVQESGTTLTEIFGVGPVIAAVVIGEAGDTDRFAGRDRFAPYNGTAPIEVSSGNRKVHRLSRRGNRRLNHAVHMAAVTQVSQRHSDGGAYHDKKVADDKTPKKRREPSNARSAMKSTSTRRPTPPTPPRAAAREGNGGTTLPPARPAHIPHTGSSAKPLPDLAHPTIQATHPLPTAVPSATTAVGAGRRE